VKIIKTGARDSYLRAYFGTFLFLIIVIAAMLAAKLLIVPDEPLFSETDMSAVAAMASASLHDIPSDVLPPVVTEDADVDGEYGDAKYGDALGA